VNVGILGTPVARFPGAVKVKAPGGEGGGASVVNEKGADVAVRLPAGLMAMTRQKYCVLFVRLSDGERVVVTTFCCSKRRDVNELPAEIWKV
jgi:hypothetical protein